MDSPPSPEALRLIEKRIQRQVLEKQKHWRALCRSGSWMALAFVSLPLLAFAFHYLGWNDLVPSLVFMALYCVLIWQTLSLICAAFMFILCSSRG